MRALPALLACVTATAAFAGSVTSPAITDTPLVRPTPVTVLNWPLLQQVAGSLSIDNWPALQQVSGTVNVGNLPLADDGSVRVTGQCPSPTPLTPQYLDLLPDVPVTIHSGDNWYSVTVDARGYTRVGIDLAGEGVNANVEWTWSNINELFAAVPDLRNGTNVDECQGTPAVHLGQPRYRLICMVSGEQLRIRVRQWFDTNPVTGLGVYLIP